MICLAIFERIASHMKSKAVVSVIIILMATLYLAGVVFVGNKNGDTHANKSAVQEMQKPEKPCCEARGQEESGRRLFDASPETMLLPKASKNISGSQEVGADESEGGTDSELSYDSPTTNTTTDILIVATVVFLIFIL